MTNPPSGRRRAAPASIAHLKRWNARQHLLPKCGAHARTTGEPCRKPALANGRCRYHGGRTPSGKGWHTPRWPKRWLASANDKLGRKLNDLQRAAKMRSKRVAAMSAEERARHGAWQATHRPGVDRAALREERRRAEEARAILTVERPDRTSPEVAALDDTIEKLRQLIAELEAQDLRERGEGVFG